MNERLEWEVEQMKNRIDRMDLSIYGDGSSQPGALQRIDRLEQNRLSGREWLALLGTLAAGLLSLVATVISALLK